MKAIDISENDSQHWLHVYCAWCSDYLHSLPIDKPAKGDSHGICPPCYEKEMADFKAMKGGTKCESLDRDSTETTGKGELY